MLVLYHWVKGDDVVEKSKATTAFSKTDSMCLKGVAIVLLMCIHCFGSTSRFAGYEFNFWPLSQDLYVDLAYYCKICVSLFAFISGYGLYLSAKNKVEDLTTINKWTVSRVVKTLSGFWYWYIICFVVIFFYNGLPKKIYFGDGIVRGSIYMLIDFLGLGELFGTPVLSGSWWYMSAAVVYIVLMPLVVRWTKKWGWFSLLSAIVIIPRILFNSDFFGASNIFTFFLPVYFGALFAEFNVFEKIEEFTLVKNKKLNEILLLGLGVITVLVSIYIWIRVPYKVLWEFHFGVAPVILIIFFNRFIFRQGGFLRKTVNSVFFFLGKYSMDMYIFHTLLREQILRDFLYNMKYPIFTILSLLIISLGIAVVFGFVKKLIKYDNLIAFGEKKLLSLFPVK